MVSKALLFFVVFTISKFFRVQTETTSPPQTTTLRPTTPPLTTTSLPTTTPPLTTTSLPTTTPPLTTTSLPTTTPPLTTTPAPTTTPRPWDIWDDAALVWEDLKSACDQTQDYVFDRLPVLTSAIEDLADETRADGEARIKEAYANFAIQLEALSVIAELTHKSQCLDNQQVELEHYANSLILDLEDCIYWLKSETVLLLKGVDTYVWDAKRKVADFKTQMEDECSRENGNEECITKIIEVMQTDIEYLPKVMLDQFSRLQSNARDSENDITECSDKRTQLVYSEGNRIISEVEQCVSDS